MAGLEKLRAENRRLRRELRAKSLEANSARAAMIAHRRNEIDYWKKMDGRVEEVVDRAIRSRVSGYKLDQGQRIIGGGLCRNTTVLEGVYGLFGVTPWNATLTVNDLAEVTRAEVAGAKGVGPRTVEALEAALAEEGLSWAEEVAG
jgi:hypothetical protein